MVFLNSASFALAETYKGTEVSEILPRSTWENSESLKKLLTYRLIIQTYCIMPK